MMNKKQHGISPAKQASRQCQQADSVSQPAGMCLVPLLQRTSALCPSCRHPEFRHRSSVAVPPPCPHPTSLSRRIASSAVGAVTIAGRKRKSVRPRAAASQHVTDSARAVPWRRRPTAAAAQSGGMACKHKWSNAYERAFWAIDSLWVNNMSLTRSCSTCLRTGCE